MMESSALDACVEYSFDNVSVTVKHLLNWKYTILDIIVVFVSTIYGFSQWKRGVSIDMEHEL